MMGGQKHIIPIFPFLLVGGIQTKCEERKKSQQQTSTKVVQIEEPIQQKREMRPITSACSLFYNKPNIFISS